MQRVLGRHVDLAVVDVAQHGLKGLPAGHHLPNGDVHLAVLGHEGPEHGLKVAANGGPALSKSASGPAAHPPIRPRDTPHPPGAGCQNGLVGWPRVPIQQQRDVTELCARPLQVCLHVLNQRRAWGCRGGLSQRAASDSGCRTPGHCLLCICPCCPPERNSQIRGLTLALEALYPQSLTFSRTRPPALSPAPVLAPPQLCHLDPMAEAAQAPGPEGERVCEVPSWLGRDGTGRHQASEGCAHPSPGPDVGPPRREAGQLIVGPSARCSLQTLMPGVPVRAALAGQGPCSPRNSPGRCHPGTQPAEQVSALPEPEPPAVGPCAQGGCALSTTLGDQVGPYRCPRAGPRGRGEAAAASAAQSPRSEEMRGARTPSS